MDEQEKDIIINWTKSLAISVDVNTIERRILKLKLTHTLRKKLLILKGCTIKSAIPVAFWTT